LNRNAPIDHTTKLAARAIATVVTIARRVDATAELIANVLESIHGCMEWWKFAEDEAREDS
jgi:hypothetical protein